MTHIPQSVNYRTSHFLTCFSGFIKNDDSSCVSRVSFTDIVCFLLSTGEFPLLGGVDSGVPVADSDLFWPLYGTPRAAIHTAGL